MSRQSRKKNNKDNNQYDRFQGKGFDKKGDSKHSKNKWNNDPRWHILSPQVLADIGKVSTYYPLGQDLKLAPTVQAEDVTISRFAVMPGLINIKWMPTFGASTNGASGINLAANQLYTTIRHEFGGRSDYVAPDLFMMIGAMDSIYILYEFLVRAYGVLSTYDPLNRYKPRAYFEAMNLDFESFHRDPAGFKSWLDYVAAAINQRSVPETIDLINYHSSLCKHIFKDHEGDKAQEYMYSPALVYQYEGYTDRKGGRLVPRWLQNHHNITVPKFTLSAMQDLMDELVSSVISDGDTGIMMSDMMKAFGAENMHKIVPVEDGYKVTPEYSYDDLMTIHNTQLMGWTETIEPTISQDSAVDAIEGGVIISNNDVFCTAAGLGPDVNTVFDSDKRDPTPEQLVEWLRFHNGYGNVTTTNTVSWAPASRLQRNELTAMTSAVALVMDMWLYSSAGDNFLSYAVSGSVISLESVELGAVLMLSNFDWAPLITVVDKSVNTAYNLSGDYWYGEYEMITLYGDTDWYGIMPGTLLNMYKDSSNLAEFNVRA